MTFETIGERKNEAVLFFHAMGVTGGSSVPVAEYLKDRYYCILPTSSVYSKGQRYVSKENEVREILSFLYKEGIQSLKMVVASSLGADVASAFLSMSTIKVEYAFFDGGQFAQIRKAMRMIMTPFLYAAIKSLYWSKGKTLKRILWCDDENIKPYFIEAGRNLKYGNLCRQMKDSLLDKPFIKFNNIREENCYFEFGSREEHFKYRNNVIAAYPKGKYPIFKGFNHMEYQIRDPEGFARMLLSIMSGNGIPELPFLE